MTTIEIRHTGRTPGECFPIPGWVVGRSAAVITWRGTDGTSDVYSRTLSSEREVLQLLGAIGHYTNVELVSAEQIQ